jgi:hypothetical protein
MRLASVLLGSKRRYGDLSGLVASDGRFAHFLFVASDCDL